MEVSKPPDNKEPLADFARHIVLSPAPKVTSMESRVSTSAASFLASSKGALRQGFDPYDLML